MLDPTRLASAMCGRGKQGAALRQRLQLAALLASPAAAATSGSAILYPGLDGLHFPVTAHAQARSFFQQGLMQSYGFNHAAAIASFREAQRLDPACAMCWWGEAFALGPNINAPMDPSSNAETVAAVRKAQSLRQNASPAERALIDAIALRYSDDPAAERVKLDKAYADAMLAAAARYPELDDISLIAAEAVMNTSPWDYWLADRTTPKFPEVATAVQLVEKVYARNPDHPQAAHLYIHLLENNVGVKRAEAVADRLARPLAPGSGHLVHMPAHIYYVLGRYGDSIRSNIVAARADEEYIRLSGDTGLVRFGYYPHNVHFIVTSAQMAGDMNTAVREAQRLASILSVDVATQVAWTQAIHAAPYFAYAQVARPAEILALPEPDARLPYVAGIRHYARAVAHAQRRDRAGFRRELAALKAIRTTGNFEINIAQAMPAQDLLLIAETVARARMASASRKHKEAVRLYREAIAIEDRIPYLEPPYWYYPIRQSLGAALFRAGRPDEARQVFREALMRSPANGWALYGLAASERALGNRIEAAAAEQALDRAWLGRRKWLRMDRL
jgi:tetratricopeptide (TPR) repeat protein